MLVDYLVDYNQLLKILMGNNDCIGIVQVLFGMLVIICVLVVVINVVVVVYGGNMQLLVQLVVVEFNQGYGNSNVGLML